MTTLILWNPRRRLPTRNRSRAPSKVRPLQSGHAVGPPNKLMLGRTHTKYGRGIIVDGGHKKYDHDSGWEGCHGHGGVWRVYFGRFCIAIFMMVTERPTSAFCISQSLRWLDEFGFRMFCQRFCVPGLQDSQCIHIHHTWITLKEKKKNEIRNSRWMRSWVAVTYTTWVDPFGCGWPITVPAAADLESLQP